MLIEIKTRLNIIIKVKSKNLFIVVSLIRKMVKKYNLVVELITIDNGFEFKNMGLVGYWLKINTYYCEPYTSHQRGSNENAKGLIRRVYKKGTNFSEILDKDIEILMDEINNMPRKNV